MDLDFKKYIESCSYPYETTDDKYTMCVVLFNNGNECPLRQQTIKSLIINDNFNNTFHDGILDIRNDNDILESSNEPALKLLAPGFKLINNARDFVFIYISIYDENNTANIDNPSNLMMLFVIDKSEDLFINSEKIKRLYLKDYTEEVLTEYVNGFSTSGYAYKLAQFVERAQEKKSKNNTQINFDYNDTNLIKLNDDDKLTIPQLSNEQRSLSTGRCIAFLLKKAFPDSTINTNLWDFGGPKVFYSSSSNESLLETLNNLLILHNASSTDNDKCYLDYQLNYKTNDYEWSFFSISKKFQYSNKQFLLESMELSLNNVDMNGSQSDDANNKTPAAFNFAGNTGIIKNFFFSDFSTHDNIQNIKSHFIYNYNNINKEFLIDSESSNFKNILQSFLDNYSSDLFPNTPYNALQLNNKNISHDINLYPPDTNTSVGRNQNLYRLLCLNNSIQFTVIGGIYRKAGYFIALKKKDAPGDNQFFNKILGNYFILNTQHIFNDKNYINNIIAVKPYYNNKPIILNNYVIPNE